MSDYFPTIQSSTRWLTEEVFKLIELVQKDEAIYNPRHKYYFCRPYVENFWREVDQKLDKNPGASLAKWTNLRISFRREFTNYLEEQVPPCWSYFDRMFFLHPYLRKKHQQPTRPGESSLQETLSLINELPNRLDRRGMKDSIKSTASSGNNPHTTKDSEQDATASVNEQQPSLADNYFDYYDDTEHNNSELDEIIDDDQHSEVAARYPQIILETTTPHNKIKSECEDEVHEDDYEELLETRHDVNTDIERMGEMSTRNANGSTGLLTQARLGKRSQQQMRLEHLNRLQTRSYHEDLRAKRSRSPDRIQINTQAIPLTGSNVNLSQRLSCATTVAHSSTNVSFVRPTYTKTTDSSSGVSNVLDTTTTTNASISSHQLTQQQLRYNSYYSHHNSRADNIGTASLPATTSNPTTSINVSTSSANAQSSRQLVSPTVMNPSSTPHLELCDCKTDPDAMFLMSLLPDIQKLNGRDRGKIKIAFQNILQDYLYPD